MAYIDWWNRTGPITMGERFGLNEISTARNTLSPTKSYTEDRIDMKPGGIVEPGVEHYALTEAELGEGFEGEPHHNWTPENLKKYKSYLKDKDFIKFQKDNPKLSNRWLVDRYSRILLRKNKIVGVQGLVDALGARQSLH